MKSRFIVIILGYLFAVWLTSNAALAQSPEPQKSRPMKEKIIGGTDKFERQPKGWGEMMGMCRMLAKNSEIEVNNISNGVTITLTSKDAKEAARLQKRAQIIKLQKELRELEK